MIESYAMINYPDNWSKWVPVISKMNAKKVFTPGAFSPTSSPSGVAAAPPIMEVDTVSSRNYADKFKWYLGSETDKMCNETSNKESLNKIFFISITLTVRWLFCI